MSSSKGPVIKVYTRLTLQEAEVQALLPGAIVAPPIERGDIAKDIRERVHVIAIVDGKFHQSLAVTPGEVMDALRTGIKVYGSSSMGALRGAELADYGMLGVGAIFEHIRSALYFRDDFLGQAFSPDFSKIVALPLVDLLFNVRRLVKSGRLDEKRGRAVVRAYEELHYLDRNSATLARTLAAKHAADDPIHAAARRAVAGMGSQKKRDALALLRRVRADLAKVQRVNRSLSRAKPRRVQTLFERRGAR